MCFSATASFSAGVLLSGLGAASLQKAKAPREYPFAAVPLLFGIQQITEGFLWLSMTHPDYAGLQADTTWLFLLFAQPLWPLWAPWSMWLLEKDEKRKRWLTVFLGAGILLSVYFLYCMFTFDLTAAVLENHIRYYLYFPETLEWITGPLYLLTTLVPLFISSVPKMKIYALINLVSFAISLFFFFEYLLSVWCFFAACLSIAVLVIMTNMERDRADKIKLQAEVEGRLA